MSYDALAILNSTHLIFKKMNRPDLEAMMEAVIRYESTVNGETSETIPLSLLFSLGTRAPIAKSFYERTKSSMSSYLNISQDLYGCENAESLPVYNEKEDLRYLDTMISMDGLTMSQFTNQLDNGVIENPFQ